MNGFVNIMNLWGQRTLDFAVPMFWQSALLIAVIAFIDYVFRSQMRAAVRYALWMVVLAKLLIPPTFALPTAPSWWMRPKVVQEFAPPPFVVVQEHTSEANAVAAQAPITATPQLKLSLAGWVLLAHVTTALILLGWLVWRWGAVTREIRRAAPASDALYRVLDEARQTCGVRWNVELRLTDLPISPALCGLWRPVILLPRHLAEELSPDQLRIVLIHELVHLQRSDV